ncbi:2-oxo acid dehydrogenase subunit E2 [Nocardia pseudovaccinii]|uniref:2-oxo acid dehydrogenase subunit E2 n=1 Tax=Nocardia pseudovaccinii TaxID=189540 RepID=UPI0007A551AD|nr:2-oxo acid dehydrogenase subunit E2 [Nocardia pseudovaccinii]
MTLDPAIYDVPMPSLGDHVDEATISRWLVQPGEHVAEGAALLEVATDKVDTEIAAPVSGTLVEMLAEEGDVVAVGTSLARVTVASAAIPVAAVPVAPAASIAAPPASAASLAPLAPPAPAAPPALGAPLVASAAPAIAPEPRAAAPVAAAAHDATRPVQTEQAADGTLSRTEKLPKIRRTIAARMVESLHVSAQLTTVLEVDVTEIARLRTAHKDEFLRRTGCKLSFLPFFAKATIEALAGHPTLNASLNADATEATYYRSCHLGIAVDSDKGLMVPVIRDAHRLGIAALAVAIADCADRVRTGKVAPGELSGGTFTLTNTGSRGALFDTPIINQPQTGILGTGAVVDRVVPVPDQYGELGISVRSMAYLSITYDHRLVDGADAARFLTVVKRRLESGFTPADLA